MSEYWVSKKKYFCKYCDTYIADDAPSRQHHENGLRHKGNLERFIRGIYKAGEKQKKDLEEEKREMKRVEQAAAAAFADDVGAGRAKPSAPVASTSSAPKKPAAKPSNPFANYSTAQSLGYSDPDAERLAAELERRRSQGVAGEWQVLPLPVASTSEATSDLPGPSSPSSTPASEIGAKREAEAPLDEEDTRTFKIRKKTVNTGLGEIYDPGAIPIKIKKKEDPKPDPTSILPSTQEPASTVGAPKWTATQWKRPGEASHSQVGEGSRTTTGDPIKVEDEAPSTSSKWTRPQWSQPLPDLKQEERKSIFGNVEQTEANTSKSEEHQHSIKAEPDIKTEDTLPSSLSEGTPTAVFKKRKVPNGAGRGRREVLA